MIEKIKKLQKENNAVILAHNYVLPEIQDIADFIGDSLGLAREAARTSAEIIVFCGVHFMAETASIISPDKKVLIPDLNAGCSLAESINAEQLRRWKKENPGAVVVSYVNTTSEVKAESDYCVTSSNAVKVINAIPIEKQILFLPDKFLGKYAAAVSGRNIKLWNGACHVHEKIGEIDFNHAHEKYPCAEFLIHPECGCSTSCMLKAKESDHFSNTYIYSTEGMMTHIKNSEANEFVVATEVGVLHRMKKARQDAAFRPVSETAICEYMKMITLEKLYDSLLNQKYEVKVPTLIADKARLPIQRMLEIG